MLRLRENLGSIIQCGREIRGEELDEIQETVRLFPALSRWELAQTICEHLEWITASGGYKTDACLKLLQRLEAKGRLRLPVKRAISPQRHAPIVLTPRTGPRAEIGGSVRDVGPLSVGVVKGREPTGLWNEYPVALPLPWLQEAIWVFSEVPRRIAARNPGMPHVSRGGQGPEGSR